MGARWDIHVHKRMCVYTLKRCTAPVGVTRERADVRRPFTTLLGFVNIDVLGTVTGRKASRARGRPINSVAFRRMRRQRRHGADILTHHKPTAGV